MASRVSTSQLRTDFIRDLNKQQVELLRTQEKVNSGLDVQRPSDDVARAPTIEELQSTLTRLNRHQQRVTVTTSFLERQEEVVTEANNLMIRASEIAAQGTNEALSGDDRSFLAEEVWALRDALVSLGNTKYQGSYIFGGLDDSDPPFDRAADYTVPGATAPFTANHPANHRYAYDNTVGADFLGDQTRDVFVSDTETVKLNTPGDVIFEQGIAALERLGRALVGVTTHPTDGTTVLSDGSTATLNVATGVTVPPGPDQILDTTVRADFQAQTAEISSALTLIQDSRERYMIPELASLGARLSRLEQVGKTLETVKLATETTRARYQDADIFDAASQLTALNNSFEALLAVHSQLANQSLLNFL